MKTYTHPVEESRLGISDALNFHLSSHSPDCNSISDYLEHGGKLVDNHAIDALRHMLPSLHVKMHELENSPLLRQKIQILELYFRECYAERQTQSAALRDTAFALLYFIRGFDRIPDSVPEIGYLDDALVALSVLQFHRTTLRAHWLRRGRPWPADL